jgi:hypothetical protein
VAGVVSAIAGVLGGLVKPITDYYARKRELSAQEHANALKLLEAQGERQAALMAQGLAADANWEMEFARQAASSWKDEYVLGVVTLPLILCFHPSYVSVVAAGFEAISATPVWYQTVVISLLLSTVGIRWWRRTQSDT